MARRVYSELSACDETDMVFVEYFFDGKRFGIKRKLLGYERLDSGGGGAVLRLGLLRIPFFLMRFRPSVAAIVTFERFAAIALLCCVPAGIPVAYIAHGIVRFENENFRKGIPAGLRRRDSLVERLLFKYSSVVFLLSEQSLQLARSFYRVPDHRCRFADNGVDAVFGGISRALPGKERLFTAVFTGDPSRPEKGWSFLLEALSHLEAPLRLFVTTLGMPDATLSTRIELVQHPPMTPSDLAAAYAEADLVICSGSYEPFSIATAEAMAAGLPAVVTSTSGIARHIREGYNGFTVDYGDSRKLASIIDTFRSDTELLRRMSANARLIGTELSWSAVAGRYLKEFKELSERKRNAGRRGLKK